MSKFKTGDLIYNKTERYKKGLVVAIILNSEYTHEYYYEFITHYNSACLGDAIYWHKSEIDDTWDIFVNNYNNIWRDVNA